jgi:hypothetical protein
MNIINAIINLVNNPVLRLLDEYKGRNRANEAGKALEEYIKDLFAGSYNMEESKRRETLLHVFSYLGNNSNPPDAMLKGGDAIEVKKIETVDSALALNSSYPKHTIKSTSPMISKACRQAETWEEKDMIYAVGVVDKKTNNIKRLSMVYGLDYCATDEIYSRIKTKIKEGVETIPDIEFAKSKELAHINKVDPMGITYMRVRGMWGIKNPWKVFSYVYSDNSNKFDFMCIINNSKWSKLGNTDELVALADKENALKIDNIKIKNPNNLAMFNDAKLITFKIKE